MNSLARWQFNYDQAQPTDYSKREALVEARTEQLEKDMWQDLEYLTDAVSDAIASIGWYRNKPNSRVHPLAVTWLTLLRDGSDDIEAMHMLREATKEYIRSAANDKAEEEIDEPSID